MVVAKVGGILFNQQYQVEFLYIDDLADALVTVMLRYEDKETINVGTGFDKEKNLTA